MDLTIKHAAYHRNGVGGEGFYVALVTEADEPGVTYLCTSFQDAMSFAVVDVDQAAAGNIYMHPMIDTNTLEDVPNTGHNAFRGDQFAAELYDRIRAHVEAQYDAQRVALTAQLQRNRNQGD